MRVHLNVDLGELPDESLELYSLATFANVACGAHAGDDSTMLRALEAARSRGCRVAAHPSYPDREAFGRRPRFCDAAMLRGSIAEQCARLQSHARSLSLEPLTVLKPHGALYHDITIDEELAEALLAGARDGMPTLTTLVGPPTYFLEDFAQRHSLHYLREGFADRRYDANRKLVPRKEPNALITDPAACAAQALALAKSGDFHTLCAHGDTPSALDIVRAVREALLAAGCLELS